MEQKPPDRVERGLPVGVEAKLFASEKAVEAADLAIQVFSGYRYVGEYPARKYMRDTWVMTLHEDTGQLRKLLIGRAETGVSAFP